MQHLLNLKIARRIDLPQLKAFLSRKEIDYSFSKPLSQRDRTIQQRVSEYFDKGFWVLGKDQESIIGTIAFVNLKQGLVDGSTFALAPNYKRREFADEIFEFGIKEAERRFKPNIIQGDCSEGNRAFGRYVVSKGFERIRTYEDPIKRPEGVKSVLYQKFYSRENS